MKAVRKAVCIGSERGYILSGAGGRTGEPGYFRSTAVS